MKIRFVADSSANLTHPNSLHVHSVPLRIVVGQNTFVDDNTGSVTQLLSTLRVHKGQTSTACPGVGDWLEAFGDADIVYGVAITSGLSGCWQSAQIAAAEYMEQHPDRKVFILDSLSAGPELELIMEKYRELVEADCDFDTVCREIQTYAEQCKLWFSLESLDNFAKNGRVSKTVALAVGILGIRVVGRASDEGILDPRHKVRGEKKAIACLVESLMGDGYKGGKVRISHTQNYAAAQALTKALRERFPEADIRIRDNALLCAYYAEAGGLLVGFET